MDTKDLFVPEMGNAFWVYQLIQIFLMLGLVALILFYPRKDRNG